MRLPLLICLAAAAWAADPVAELSTALRGEDRDAKRAAIAAAAGAPREQDAVVYAALIAAAADRQAGDDALRALRGRSGVGGAAGGRGPGYPGAPTSDDAAGWSTWWAARQRDLEQQAKLKALAEAIKEKGPATAAPVAEQAPAEPAAEEQPRAIPDDLGRLARISFKDGGNILAYIRSRRLDSEGKLLSVRIVHRDGVGEETISAQLIARIDENAQ